MYLSLALPYLAEKKNVDLLSEVHLTHKLCFPSLTNEKKKFNRLQYYLKFVIIYCFIFNWRPSRCSKADVSSFIPPSSEPWYTPHRRWNLIYTPSSVICLMCTWRFRGFFVEHLNDNTKREIKNYELRHTGNKQKGYFLFSARVSFKIEVLSVLKLTQFYLKIFHFITSVKYKIIWTLLAVSYR